MNQVTHPSYSSPCGWDALLGPRRTKPSLEGDLVCDVAIVGAGYTGLAAARRWAENAPDDQVVVIDSSDIGEGNPGRNSGFLLEISLANDADASNMRRMNECNHLIAGAMQEIVELVRAGDIDCELHRSGTYRAAAGKVGRAALDNYAAFLDAAALPYETLGREELEERLGTRFYQRGLYSPHCYLAQPAALIRGIAEQLPASVSVFERTPATRLSRTGAEWLLQTSTGTVHCSKVVLANNAFCKNLGVGTSRVVAMYTYAALTKPLPPEILATLGSESSWGLLPAHRLGSTLRRTTDGRLLIRSLYGYEKEAPNAEVARRLGDSLRRRFPQLGDFEFDYCWSGATGFTLNGAPIWGETAPGLFVSAGCNGGGVVKGTLFGGLLADLAFGLPVPDMGALFGTASWVPPGPIRRLGFQAIAALERRRGSAEI
jgi:glycine/D-amino acid oxidase-like deaminating enzyme